MEKISDLSLTGNELYEGFCMDLLKEIAEIVSFRYTVRLVADGKYGSPEKTGWTGMVRELMDKVCVQLIVIPSGFFKRPINYCRVC